MAPTDTLQLLLLAALALPTACWQAAGVGGRLARPSAARAAPVAVLSVSPNDTPSFSQQVGLWTGLDRRSKLKRDMLALAKETNRGATASPKQIARMERMAAALASLNPNKFALSAPELNGRWQLMYTSSKYTLREKQPVKPVGPIHQEVDVSKLYARGIEHMQLGPFRILRWVDIDLKPVQGFPARVHTRFTLFRFGSMGLPLPVFTTDANGHLDIIYLDKDFRLARGDKGNLFVTVKDDL